MNNSMWRLAEARDAEVLKRLNAEQREMLKTAVDEPNYFDKPVLLTIVREEDGEVKGAVYFEAVAEMCVIGTDPVTTVELKAIAEQLKIHLRVRGFRWVRCIVPNRPKLLAKTFKKHLEQAGFRLARGYADFFLKLQEGSHDGSR